MTTDNGTAGIDPDIAAAITATARDYYEGWFEGNPDRMRRALHPALVKRRVPKDGEDVATATFLGMVEATEQREGTRHPPERRGIDITINHVHRDIADVHVTGDIYVDYLQLVRVGGHWQILNALWAPRNEPG